MQERSRSIVQHKGLSNGIEKGIQEMRQIPPFSRTPCKIVHRFWSVNIVKHENFMTKEGQSNTRKKGYTSLCFGIEEVCSKNTLFMGCLVEVHSFFFLIGITEREKKKERRLPPK